MFFAEYFGFLFDNTSWCYLTFASLFPYSLSFTFIVYRICLCLRELFQSHCVTLTLKPFTSPTTNSNDNDTSSYNDEPFT